ncbi:MAG: hypothetical protein JWQ97_3809, partial [Phenylobacterium sp.]|nr:hypothetical protein [Phenylobacterium sp.]
DLYRVAAAYNSDMKYAFMKVRERNMRNLGMSLRAFRDGGRGKAVEERRYAEAMLLLLELEQVGMQSQFITSKETRTAMVDLVSEKFWSFVRKYGATGGDDRSRRSIGR